jgi:hypothetical protein
MVFQEAGDRASLLGAPHGSDDRAVARRTVDPLVHGLITWLIGSSRCPHLTLRDSLIGRIALAIRWSYRMPLGHTKPHTFAAEGKAYFLIPRISLGKAAKPYPNARPATDFSDFSFSSSV